MTGPLGDWANLLLRWTHFIAGIAWIGSSFYFIWLDRALRPPTHPRPGVEGELWMVHSGGFYQVEKRRPAPGEIPRVLHWFKWEALLTWVSGIALLVLLYYLSDAYLLDPAVSHLGRGPAIALGVGLVVAGWVIYDLLWRSPLAERPWAATAISLVLLAVATIALCRFLSGRAAYMHLGTLLGTVMVANVWMRIIPAQREMIAATAQGRLADFTLGTRAKRRSVHNSYLTFPLLFIMMSNHFPATYEAPAPFNWVILLLLIVAGAAARHLMIADAASARWAIAPAVLALGAAVWLSTPRATVAAAGDEPTFAEVREIVNRRCLPCHSAYPRDPMFDPVPGGVRFDTPNAIQTFSQRIRARAVDTEQMPFGNKTGMTPDERALLGRWIAAGAPLR
jgi:uncharacterized membrane protein